jgi:Beta-lactamase
VSVRRVSGWVQERDSDQFARFVLTVSARTPRKILTLPLVAIPRPAEFPIARLAEGEAIAGVEALRLALDDPVGKRLSGYPNGEVASKVTVRHLLTHTGGTGDIFGTEFDRNRLTLREHGDYVKLYGSRPAELRAGLTLRVLELRLRPARRAHRSRER